MQDFCNAWEFRNMREFCNTPAQSERAVRGALEDRGPKVVVSSVHWVRILLVCGLAG